MGRVVGGNHIHRMIQNALNQRNSVLFTAKGGIHFEPSLVAELFVA
jgi:hypothetical protein